MADLNATLSILSPYVSTLDQVLGVVSLIVGGIFGIYVLTLIARLVFFRKIYKSFNEIKETMKRLENKIDKLGKKKQ